MQTVSKEKLLENAETISNFVKEKISEPNKTTILKLFDEEIGEMFFTAPASGKTRYHLACTGGLAQHCLNVYDAFTKLNDAFACGFSDEDMFLCSLMHDFGKVCSPDLKSPHYQDQKSEWKIKNGELYEPNYESGYFTNRDRTSFLLQSLGIKLTAEQFQATLIADGWFSEQNKSYNTGVNNDVCKLSLFMHFADFIATIGEKE